MYSFWVTGSFLVLVCWVVVLWFFPEKRKGGSAAAREGHCRHLVRRNKVTDSARQVLRKAVNMQLKSGRVAVSRYSQRDCPVVRRK
jgi:hypothetical protein